jgi:ApaG protein
MLGSETATHGIRIKVRSRYSEEHSRPEQNHWFFLYTITITNEGRETVQLLRRHWTITDANGTNQTVDGEGVVGEQPILEPGQSFQYTSACPLLTEVGSMYGYYTMRSSSGNEFNANIAPFTLSQATVFH